jgi:hypothetical protein
MTVNIDKKDGSSEEMPIETFTRWMCLVEAFTILEDKIKDMELKKYNIVFPRAIDDYIKERYHGMLHDVTCEVNAGRL